MDRLTPEQRKRNMRANKASGTTIEKIISSRLWAEGYRYRKSPKDIIGKPDFVFRSRKLAIFCDGEFWHGKDWDIHKLDHKSNITFWHTKIQRNIDRDKEVNKTLKESGWTVLRFWETEIRKTPEKCIERIKAAYEKTGTKQ